MRLWKPNILSVTSVFFGLALVLLQILDYFNLYESGSWIDKHSHELLLVFTTTILVPGFVEIRRLAKLDGIEEQLNRLDITTLSKSIYRQHYCGVIKIDERFDTDAFLTQVNLSKSIRILQTFVPNLDSIEEALLKAVLRGATVQILLVAPNSMAAELRGRALRHSRVSNGHTMKPTNADLMALDITMRVEENLDRLARMHDALPIEYRNHLEVRLHHSLPSIALYQADKYFSVGVFVHDALAIMRPQLILDDDEEILAKVFTTEFETVWATMQRNVSFDGGWRYDLSETY